MRIDSTAPLPGKEYKITSWQNRSGTWQQYGDQVLRLDFAPQWRQTPGAAFGALPTSDYHDARIEKDSVLDGTPCYWVRAKLSSEAIDALRRESSKYQVEDVFAISKADWLPRAIDSFDEAGTLVRSLVFSKIERHLALDDAFMNPPETNVVILTDDRDMAQYVTQFNRPFVPAVKQVIAERARTGRRIAIALLVFAAFSAALCALLIRRIKRKSDSGG